MSRKLLIIISTVTITVVVIIVSLNATKRDNSQDIFPAVPSNESAVKTNLATSAEIPFFENAFEIESDFDVEGSFLLETDIAVIEKDIPDPVSNEVRLIFKVTANMSDAQLAQFQKLRKGEVIRSLDGTLLSTYQERLDCLDNLSGDSCKTIIENTKTLAVIYDGRWAQGYQPTGLGQEVVKVE